MRRSGRRRYAQILPKIFSEAQRCERDANSSQVKYLYKDLVRAIHSATKTILVHFHYCLKAQIPFQPGFDWNSPGARRMAALDQDQLDFMEDYTRVVHQKSMWFDNPSMDTTNLCQLRNFAPSGTAMHMIQNTGLSASCLNRTGNRGTPWNMHLQHELRLLVGTSPVAPLLGLRALREHQWFLGNSTQRKLSATANAAHTHLRKTGRRRTIAHRAVGATQQPLVRSISTLIGLRQQCVSLCNMQKLICNVHMFSQS